MIKAEDFESALRLALEEERENVERISAEEIEKVATETVELLRNHPKIPQRTGKYKKSFTLKKISRKQSGTYYRVYAAGKQYRLTHLLEYGHATRNGGRTKAFPHWKDAQEFVQKLPERLKRRLSDET